MFLTPGSRPVYRRVGGSQFFLPAVYEANTVLVNFALGNMFKVTLTANSTLANPQNALTGMSGIIKVTQDNTGSRTLSYGSNYKFDGDTAFPLGITANKSTYLTYSVMSPTSILIIGLAFNTSA